MAFSSLLLLDHLVSPRVVAGAVGGRGKNASLSGIRLHITAAVKLLPRFRRKLGGKFSRNLTTCAHTDVTRSNLVAGVFLIMPYSPFPPKARIGGRCLFLSDKLYRLDSAPLPYDGPVKHWTTHAADSCAGSRTKTAGMRPVRFRFFK